MDSTNKPQPATTWLLRIVLSLSVVLILPMPLAYLISGRTFPVGQAAQWLLLTIFIVPYVIYLWR